MPEQFLHGVEVIEMDGGPRPIKTAKSSVVGLIGTAPNADAAKFPLNTPVLIAGNRKDAAGLGNTGTLAAAVDGVFDQAGAMIVVIRVAEGATDAETFSNVIGGVDDATGAYEGVEAFLSAESVLGVKPRILIAPGFTNQTAILTALVTIAERLRAVIIADGSNTNDSAAIQYAAGFGSDRIFLVDPWVTVWDTTADAEALQPGSARVAGLLVKSDNERGFWWSPSNLEINGITGTGRAVDFSLGDVNCRANLLNENKVATIIRQEGYRLWGNRTLSADPKWAFLSVRRTADMINDSLQKAHLWAVDRNITSTYIEDVREGVNAYLRHLTQIGAIIGGECWFDPDANAPDQIAQGKVVFDFNFTPPYPAEHITFRSRLVNDYLEEIA